MVLCIAVVDLTLAIVYRYIMHGHHENIGYAAHLGGAAVGFLVGMNVLRNFKKKVEPCNSL